MGRVVATAITCTHRCRWFWFLLCFIVAFPCCFLPSQRIHDDVHEFSETFVKGERGGVFYIALRSIKIVDSIYAGHHCVALLLLATQTNKK